MSKETTKLKGNFVTREEIGAALFFAFMAGACATGIYFDLIDISHKLPTPASASTTYHYELGTHSQQQMKGPPYRFRQFH